MHDHPSPPAYVYLAAIAAAGTAAACWVVKRERNLISQVVRARCGGRGAAVDRSVYWQVYADVMDDLGGVGSGGQTR